MKLPPSYNKNGKPDQWKYIGRANLGHEGFDIPPGYFVFLGVLAGVLACISFWRMVSGVLV